MFYCPEVRVEIKPRRELGSASQGNGIYVLFMRALIIDLICLIHGQIAVDALAVSTMLARGRFWPVLLRLECQGQLRQMSNFPSQRGSPREPSGRDIICLDSSQFRISLRQGYLPQGQAISASGDRPQGLRRGYSGCAIVEALLASIHL